MTNPFEVIEARLIAIEALLIDLKQSPKKQAAPKKKAAPADVLPANMRIKKVGYARIGEIMSNPGAAQNLGLYIAKISQDRWVALINLTGEACSVEFGSKESTLHCLRDQYGRLGR